MLPCRRRRRTLRRSPRPMLVASPACLLGHGPQRPRMAAAGRRLTQTRWQLRIHILTRVLGRGKAGEVQRRGRGRPGPGGKLTAGLLSHGFCTTDLAVGGGGGKEPSRQRGASVRGHNSRRRAGGGKEPTSP
jgi:hypothetical protein